MPSVRQTLDNLHRYARAYPTHDMSSDVWHLERVFAELRGMFNDDALVRMAPDNFARIMEGHGLSLDEGGEYSDEELARGVEDPERLISAVSDIWTGLKFARTPWGAEYWEEVVRRLTQMADADARQPSEFRIPGWDLG